MNTKLKVNETITPRLIPPEGGGGGADGGPKLEIKFRKLSKNLWSYYFSPT